MDSIQDDNGSSPIFKLTVHSWKHTKSNTTSEYYDQFADPHYAGALIPPLTARQTCTMPAALWRRPCQASVLLRGGFLADCPPADGLSSAAISANSAREPARGHTPRADEGVVRVRIAVTVKRTLWRININVHSHWARPFEPSGSSYLVLRSRLVGLTPTAEWD